MSMIWKSSIVEMFQQLIVIYRFNAIHIMISVEFFFFLQKEKKNPKIHNLNNQDKLEKENRNSDLRIPKHIKSYSNQNGMVLA